MNILITGGLGNVGLDVTKMAIEKNHNVKVLIHSNSKKNRKRMKPFKDKVKFIVGSVTDKSFIHSIMKDIDCVVHLAALLPPKSEESLEKTRSVNVIGTRNIVDALDFYGNKACLVYASSTSVFGPTNHKEPPLTVSDALNPINNYTKCKVEAESVLHDSDTRYCILRLATVMTDLGGYDLGMLKLIYDFPLDGRNEIVLSKDAATALLNCAELFCSDEDKVLQKTYLIAGGRQNGCQITNGQMINGIFEGLGLNPPSPDCFLDSMETYFMDWYDTDEAQEVLNFQNTTFDDYKAALSGKQRQLPRFLLAFLTAGLERMSPYKTRRKKDI